MNLADTLRGLWRRRLIVVPGIILTILVAIASWQLIPPSFERTGVQLLIPGTASIPPDGNPYLYLGGLSQASDVLVTAMSSERELDALIKDAPGAEIVIARDPVTSGPQILTTVTAGSDDEAEQLLEAATTRTTQVLITLQDVNGVTEGNRMSIKSITTDTESTLVDKSRILGVVGASLAVLLITLLTAGLVDGLGARRRRRNYPGTRIPELSHSDALREVSGEPIRGRGHGAPPRPLSRRRRSRRRAP